jgi:hypothetical protein
MTRDWRRRRAAEAPFDDPSPAKPAVPLPATVLIEQVPGARPGWATLRGRRRCNTQGGWFNAFCDANRAAADRRIGSAADGCLQERREDRVGDQ